MSGKSIMNKFVLRNIVQAAVSCSYFCVFYLMLLCLLDTAGVGANKMPEEDISMVTELSVSVLPTITSHEGLPADWGEGVVDIRPATMNDNAPEIKLLLASRTQQWANRTGVRALLFDIVMSVLRV